ncbi:MAG: nucleotidyltransferase domain-containing protein [Clostridia bacterium]|nr:nucleotidyltransferase domain-containing protein [Clostridia bacterium]
MINIENYISKLIDFLHRQYSCRLLYVGLQGSRLRGEATENSDIDIMVVIDGLTVSDMDHYRTIIHSLGHFEKSCGFICSKTDLANWNPLEIHHLLNSTKDYYGTLTELVPTYTKHDIRNFVKLNLNNLYHEICHKYIHAEPAKSITTLPFAYKSVFFILQNLHYLTHGEYIATKAELLPLLNGKDCAILKRSIELNNGISHDFSESFERLFTWCQDTLKSL